MNPTQDPPAPGANRRALLTLGLAGAGVAAARLVGAQGRDAAMAQTAKPAAATTTNPTSSTNPSIVFPGIPGNTIDQHVLNFALTLEILEADLYRQALNHASGRPLTELLSTQGPSAYRISSSFSTTGLSATNASDLFGYLKHFAYVEAAHRAFVRSNLQIQAAPTVSKNPGGYQFPGGIGNDLKTLMTQILALEETGVRAYLGASKYLSDLDLMQTAGQVFSTEARHSAVIAYALGRDPHPQKMTGDLEVSPKPTLETASEKYLEPATVLAAAQVYFVS